ncbi:hypothetical protein N7481_002649 [Penicillium waksmanii]|uniref:uncharacterized protein n=1 Tax=Penicillium waksmanii TaxID=69791 RepID=UPI002548EB12|nr:uncharacterized protein N7481_002649 [Penicillium waksmanii]KAJ5995672.1 hypothetical protein N7481_002649 [Penicillium waksmanii]
MTIPAAHVAQAGQGDVAPGEMAALTMQLPFNVAMENERYKSKAIEEMHHRTMLRGPLLRSKKYSAPDDLIQAIGKKLANEESAMIQIVGTEPHLECKASQRQSTAFADTLAGISAEMQATLAIAREEMQEIEAKFRDIHALLHDRQLDDTQCLQALRRLLPKPMDRSQIVGRFTNIRDRMIELENSMQ